MTDDRVVSLADRRQVGMAPDEKEATVAELRALIEDIESGEVYALAVCALGQDESAHIYAGVHDDPLRLFGCLAALNQYLIHHYHVAGVDE